MKLRMSSVTIVLGLMLSTSNHGVSLRFDKTALAQSESPNFIAEIIKVEGRGVELKRAGSDYGPTKEGEKLNLGDLLRVQKGARVVVQCNPDKTTWTVPDDGLPWGVANTCSPTSQKDGNKLTQ